MMETNGSYIAPKPRKDKAAPRRGAAKGGPSLSSMYMKRLETGRIVQIEPDIAKFKTAFEHEQMLTWDGDKARQNLHGKKGVISNVDRKDGTVEVVLDGKAPVWLPRRTIVVPPTAPGVAKIASLPPLGTHVQIEPNLVRFRASIDLSKSLEWVGDRRRQSAAGKFGVVTNHDYKDNTVEVTLESNNAKIWVPRSALANPHHTAATSSSNTKTTNENAAAANNNNNNNPATAMNTGRNNNVSPSATARVRAQSEMGHHASPPKFSLPFDKIQHSENASPHRSHSVSPSKKHHHHHHSHHHHRHHHKRSTSPSFQGTERFNEQ